MRIFAILMACLAALLLYSHEAMADQFHSAMVYYPPTVDEILYVNADSIRAFEGSYKTAIMLEVYRAPEMGAKYSVLNITVNCDSQTNTVSQIFYSSSNTPLQINRAPSIYSPGSNPTKYICMTDAERANASGPARFWKMAPDTEALLNVADQIFRDVPAAPQEGTASGSTPETESTQPPQQSSAHEDKDGPILELAKSTVAIAVLSVGFLLSYFDLSEPFLWLGALGCLIFALAIAPLFIHKRRNRACGQSSGGPQN